MSAQDLPSELLAIIIQNLKGTEAAACRAVCRRLRDVVDSLPDGLWERYCRRDFPDPRATNRVSALPYRELYKSLTLWDKVEEAKMTVNKQTTLPDKCFKQIVILNNNVLAALPVSGLSSDLNCEYTKIYYYDIKTMKLVSCEDFGFYLKSFDENDKLIVLQTLRNAMWVVTKPNMKKHFVDHVHDLNDRFQLFATGVYFINQQGYLCMAQLKVIDGKEKIETEELRGLCNLVLAYACTNENAVNVLTGSFSMRTQSSIFCFRDKDLNAHIQIGYKASTVINQLRKFGFDWTNLFIMKWLEKKFAREKVNLPELESAVINCHSHIVLVGTSQGTLQIFKQPYEQNGDLKLYKVKPNRTIDISQFCNRYLIHPIQQLGVVEMENGHRLIVLCDKKLFFIDLLHHNT